MSDEAAFLAAIAAAPDDNTARLVYADWLDEYEQAGGEFLRAECELASCRSGQARWHEVFAKYRKAGVGLPAKWCDDVSRHPMAHWLAVSARSAWTRLENWCHQYHPRLLSALNPGATAEEIEAVESVIGQPLPPDVRESFTIHNGGSDFILSDDLLSTQAVAAAWEIWRGFEDYNEEFRETTKSFPENAIALDYANPGWIPLTKAGGSDYFGVDLSPESAGMVGQVINFGRDEHHKCVLASGWADFLADFATFLESGAVSGFDPDSSDPCAWCSDALGGVHCHDVLRKWRQEGRWPPRKQS